MSYIKPANIPSGQKVVTITEAVYLRLKHPKSLKGGGQYRLPFTEIAGDIWKDVPGHKMYQVSDQGRLKKEYVNGIGLLMKYILPGSSKGPAGREK